MSIIHKRAESKRARFAIASMLSVVLAAVASYPEEALAGFGWVKAKRSGEVRFLRHGSGVQWQETSLPPASELTRGR